MKKENTLYGIIGLLAGLIIGYIGANYLNRVYAPQASAAQANGSGGDLPPDHPAAGAGGSNDSNAAQNAGGPQGDVMAVIEKARNDPSNFEAQMQAAALFNQINRPEGALEFYTRAAKLKSNDYGLLVKLGDGTFDLRRYDEAAKWYEQAIKIKPGDPTVQMDLGQSYYLRRPRDLERAIASYRAALKIDPRHEKSLQNLTAALIDQGDLPGARKSIEQLAQVNPGNQALAQFRAQLKE